MSSSPFATQSAAVTALLATVAVLIGEMRLAGIIDANRFATSLDELLARSTEPSEVATEMRAAVVQMMKHAASEGTTP